jgi:hypothetical protein
MPPCPPLLLDVPGTTTRCKAVLYSGTCQRKGNFKHFLHRYISFRSSFYFPGSKVFFISMPFHSVPFLLLLPSSKMHHRVVIVIPSLHVLSGLVDVNTCDY